MMCAVPTRDRPTDRARRMALRALEVIGDELRRGRRQAGVSQARVGAAIGYSQSEVSRIEAARVTGLTIVTAAQLLAVVGRDLSVRVYPGGAPARDAAQLAILGRVRAYVSPALRWRTEVPVPILGDQRAIDLVIDGPGVSVAIECISRLDDAQAAERAARLKQRDAGLQCLVLALADTRHNRGAVAGAPSVRSSFPASAREVLAALRAGRQPAGDGIVFV